MKKLFMSVDTTSKWDTLRVSCDITDTVYQLGGKGEVVYGEPEIKWNYIVFIQGAKKIWNRGVLYDGAEVNLSNFTSQTEVKLNTSGNTGNGLVLTDSALTYNSNPVATTGENGNTYTKAEIDTLLGGINTVLDNILNN